MNVVHDYGWGKEHRSYTRADWKFEVANDNTRLGYNDWVQHQIEANDEPRSPGRLPDHES